MNAASALPCLLLASCLSATVAPRQSEPSESLEALIGPPPATGPLAAQERAFLCAVLPEHLDKLGGDQDGPAVSHEQVQAPAESVRWHAMTGLDCPPDNPPILWGSRFVESFGLSPDGTFGAIQGGWQMGPLAGAGGVCYFARRDAGWQLIGCQGLYVS